ncbi:4-hydroxy-tetrahydrodipicolinate synthase [Aestuariimicrobium sp. p3-SID1156]|uniref:4-hydroxy-tetrahydrodipicolinate synthase n=1 Tax=Aestuariimicrobium sp. p3-SID1156 TaxID=2916038 RepID=UPI00223B39D4|nr:4-hydroxy-tetrahydrodipicolinate synthase [Aestuariimicrobium sp. p3-SID1156]
MTSPRLGRLVTAMVTPFTPDGALDLKRAGELATRLVDEQANDAIVVNGTTGESPTTTEDEKFKVVEAALGAVDDRATVIAGVGSFDTAHTVRMARRAADTGAHALLVVCPYYSRPTQQGIVAHFRAVAEATDLPVMVYDIPHRTGVSMSSETLLELAELPTIVAVKDAKGDLVASSQVMAEVAAAGLELDYYSGDDAITLPLLSVGGVGVVGTSTHFSGRAMKQIIELAVRGDFAGALEVQRRWLPVFTGVFAAPGCATVKGALAAEGFDVGPLRLPMVAPDDVVVQGFCQKLRTARS